MVLTISTVLPSPTSQTGKISREVISSTIAAGSVVGVLGKLGVGETGIGVFVDGAWLDVAISIDSTVVVSDEVHPTETESNMTIDKNVHILLMTPSQATGLLNSCYGYI
jgi:hypothetical protein